MINTTSKFEFYNLGCQLGEPLESLNSRDANAREITLVLAIDSKGNRISVGDMSYQIRDSKDSPWQPTPGWFNSFVALGENLYRLSASQNKLRRLLISVPRSEFASVALAIGCSKAAHLQNKNEVIPLELNQVGVNDLIQLRGPWVKNHEIWTNPGNLVGRVLSVTGRGTSRVRIKFEFDGTSGFVEKVLASEKCPAGKEKDPLQHFRLYRVPLGTPQRDRKSDRQFETIDGFGAKRFEGWEYQINPTLAVFSQVTKISEYAKYDLLDEHLVKLLGTNHESLLSAARLDSLSNDTYPHFVNAIEQYTNFPIPNTPQAASLKTFPYVCLEGNVPILNLADDPQLANKTVIGLWETGVATLHDLSLENFLRVAHNFSPVSEVESVLSWTPPTGVQIWGWQ